MIDPFDVMNDRVAIAIRNGTARILIGSDWWDLTRFSLSDNFEMFYSDNEKEGVSGFIVLDEKTNVLMSYDRSNFKIQFLLFQNQNITITGEWQKLDTE